MRNFDPWCGAQYAEGINGQRVMFLGESHYCPPEEKRDRDFTIDIVRRSIGGKGAFFTKIAKIILDKGAGQYITGEEKAKALESIAFANFMQIVLSKPRISPTSEAWHGAGEALHRTLDELRPTVLITLGKRLERHLPQEIRNVKNMTIISLTHPSSSKFRYEDGKPELDIALGRRPVSM